MISPRALPLSLSLSLALLAGLVVSVLTAGPAAAHNTLRSTTPAADAAVGVTPAAVVLTFDEPAIAMGTRVVVTGPNGPVQVGEPRLVDTTVNQALQPGAPAGRYLVEWRVTSIDGHPITGRFTFTAEAAGRGEPGTSAPSAPTPAPVGSGGGSGWGALVAVVVLVAVLTGLLFVFRRARGTSPPRYDRSASPVPSAAESRTESRPPTDD